MRRVNVLSFDSLRLPGSAGPVAEKGRKSRPWLGSWHTCAHTRPEDYTYVAEWTRYRGSRVVTRDQNDPVQIEAARSRESWRHERFDRARCSFDRIVKEKGGAR